MSEILVDNLTGKTSAGDITVYSEGGEVTQSLQQGLAKAWVNFDGTGTVSVRDDLNVSTLDDNGTGDYTVNFTNAMANTNYSVSGSSSRLNAGDPGLFSPISFSESNIRVQSGVRTAGSSDRADISVQVQGDLA